LVGNYEYYLAEPQGGVFRGKTKSRTHKNHTTHIQTSKKNHIHHKPQHIHAARSSKKPPGLKASRWRGKDEEKTKNKKQKKHTYDASRQDQQQQKNKA